jgi:hypothetical protein
VRWRPDNSVELNVTGKADEVASVTRRMVEQLAPSPARPEATITQASPSRSKKWWSWSLKAWAFAIGLATVAGGVAAVLALFVH